MKIILKGTDQPGLDGEYEISPEPTVREITRFRKEAGISPSEMTEILSVGAIEVVPFYVYTAMHRTSRETEASGLIDLPFDTWGNADVVRAPAPEAAARTGDEEDISELPPE